MHDGLCGEDGLRAGEQQLQREREREREREGLSIEMRLEVAAAALHDAAEEDTPAH